MRFELCVLLVAHLNKAAGLQALYRVIGSIGFTAAARTVYFLSRDPDHQEQLLLLPGKANLAPAKMAGISYELKSVDLGGGIVAPRVAWHDVPEMRSADEILNPPKRQGAAPERLDAGTWLREALAAGPRPVRELKELAGEELRCSWRTVERAAAQLGVIGDGEYEQRGWRLPPEHNDNHTDTFPTPVACRNVVMSECLSLPNNFSVVLSKDDDITTKRQRHGVGELSQCDAVLSEPAIEEAAKEAAPSLFEDSTRTDLRPCTACERLSVDGFCSFYQRTMPEPATPNACKHFEPRAPDVPW
jgi:hypothetical protein